MAATAAAAERMDEREMAEAADDGSGMAFKGERNSSAATVASSAAMCTAEGAATSASCTEFEAKGGGGEGEEAAMTGEGSTVA